VVTTAEIMKSAVFWVLTPCNLEKSQRFGGRYNPYLQGRSESRKKNRMWQASLRLLFEPEKRSYVYLHRKFWAFTEIHGVRTAKAILLIS
jgi:hypothetical protein